MIALALGCGLLAVGATIVASNWFALAAWARTRRGGSLIPVLGGLNLGGGLALMLPSSPALAVAGFASDPTLLVYAWLGLRLVLRPRRA